MPPEEKPSPPPVLPYTNRPAAPADDDAIAVALHFVVGFAIHASLVVTMKLLAVRFGWPVDAICGVWVFVLIISFGVAGYLAGALNWRGVMSGTIVALILSLVASAMILRT